MKNMALHRQQFKREIRDVIRATQVAEEAETYMEKVTQGKKLTKDEKATLLANSGKRNERGSEST